jgi:hypothetical protein
VRRLTASARSRIRVSRQRTSSRRSRCSRDGTTPPLTYPDPAGEFYGYERKRIAAWYPVEVESGTKELVTGMVRATTAVLALQAGEYVVGRADAVELYAAIIGDEWSEYLQTLYGRCKRQWQYRVPVDRRDRALLQELCHRTLDFENHYFALYRTYLLGPLASSESGDCLFAAEQLCRVVYLDETIMARLRFLAGSTDGKLQEAAVRELRMRLGSAVPPRGV